MPPFLTDSLTLMLGRWSAFPARLRLMVLAGVGAGALLGLTIWALSTVPGAMRIYHPGHPDADGNGYVDMPNVNPVAEMVDLMAATRAYEANVSAIQAAKSMAQKALELGR